MMSCTLSAFFVITGRQRKRLYQLLPCLVYLATDVDNVELWDGVFVVSMVECVRQALVPHHTTPPQRRAVGTIIVQEGEP